MADQDSNNQVITIDSEISKILGLEDNFDLDPDEYLQLIREKLVQYDFLSASKNITSEQEEEQRLLAPQVRAILEQKRSGDVKFTTGNAKKKINADSFFNRKPEETKEPEKRIVDPSRLLSGSTKTGDIIKYKSQKVEELKDEKPEEDDSESKKLVAISNILDSILSTFKNQFKFDQKKTEEQRRDKETKKREKRESGLEKGFAIVKGVVKKMLAPLQNIFEQIWKYFFFTFLGKMFTDLMKWLEDPENKKKVESLGRFLKDWWPLLLGAYIAFATPFGFLVRGAIKMVLGLTGKILGLLPKLLRLSKALITSGPVKSAARLAANVVTSPAFLFPAAIAGVSVLANEVTGQRKAAKVQTENKARAQTGKGLGVQGTDTMTDKVPTVGNMGPTTPYGLLQSISSGGLVHRPSVGSYSNGAQVTGDGYSGIDNNTGISISGAGKDTQLIAARPGEVVLTPEDANKIQNTTGFDVYNFVKNRKPSYTNFDKIKMFGQVPLANAGGIIGFKDGGIVGGSGSRGAAGVGANKMSEKNPKISPKDYYALLAVSSIEDDNPQGRSDVAQSIYNRLLAASKYKANFYQKENTIKDIIIAGGGRDDGGQYEPTFLNKPDWSNITDRQSAAIAIMNSQKGRDHKWTMKDAMQQLNDTEKALNNPVLQQASRSHVGGRTFFLQAEKDYEQRPGESWRGEGHNYFFPSSLEGSQYDKERRDVSAPIPEMLLPKTKKGNAPSRTPRGTNSTNLLQSLFSSASNNIMNIFRPQSGRPQSRTKRSQGTKRPTNIRDYLEVSPRSRWGMDPRRLFGMQGGGSLSPITTRTGIDIPGGMSGADTQYLPQYNTAVQPGEEIFKYVIPKDAAQKGMGARLMQLTNQMVANSDSNSTAAKIGFRNKEIGIRPPLNRSNGGGNMVLPPITTSSSGGLKGSPVANSQDLYAFSPVLETSIDVRKMHVDMYGILD